jgi:hypothetical protein
MGTMFFYAPHTSLMMSNDTYNLQHLTHNMFDQYMHHIFSQKYLLRLKIYISPPWQY